jgi:D-alanyl-D-alanine carboxypeptidase
MVKSFGTTLTALGLIGALAACANPGASGPRSASIFGDKVDTSNIGVATRAQFALEKGDYATAVDLAERAVAGSPRDAGFRGLLANTYFASGRFASAEAAYKDSLALLPNQPQLILKLALVSIAQGKSGEALAQLEAARGYLDPSDYGLALALAGQPGSAVGVLEPAARAVGADARVRQNLALAYALQGDWTAAKTIAAQDVPADQLDARIHQWMTFAKPVRASDQVAALTGITPAASDPGQPTRLALVPQAARSASAEPVLVPVPAAAAEPAPALVAEAPATDPTPAATEYASLPVEQPVVAAEPVAAAAAEPVVVAAPAAVTDAPKARPKRVAAKAKVPAANPGLSPRAASLVHKASFPKAARGTSRSVVQLGAYASRSFVGTAWNNISKKYPALRGYNPATARFESAKGTVYRLSVQGFASDAAAREFCSALKSAGGSCFVRSVAGDAPVRLASL